MTADAPYDFPYEPVNAGVAPQTLRKYWDVSFGLQQVDGLEPSDYARKLAEGNVRGDYSLAEVGELLDAHYSKPRSCDDPSTPDNREADLVSQHITELLNDGSFSFMPDMLAIIHKRLFEGVDDAYRPGEFKSEALRKSEFILNGDSVVYADPSLIERSLEYAFAEEGRFAYAPDFDEQQLDNFSQFISRLWQVHPFCEGNTRTVAVFAILYLRYLGFDADNEPFEKNARYFRNALVRANYRNAKAGVMPDKTYLNRFFENVVAGADNELHSRDLTVQILFDDPNLRRNR